MVSTLLYNLYELHSRAASSVGITSPFQRSQKSKQFWRKADNKKGPISLVTRKWAVWYVLAINVLQLIILHFSVFFSSSELSNESLDVRIEHAMVSFWNFFNILKSTFTLVAAWNTLSRTPMLYFSTSLWVLSTPNAVQYMLTP